MTFEVEFQPLGRRVEVEEGSTVLEAARLAGVGLSAICGGAGTCGACRVRLDADAQVSPPTSSELKKIGDEGLAAGLRLACQTRPLGHVHVDVPPESLTAPQRTQVEGEDRQVALAPTVTVQDLNVPPASHTDLRADWERLSEALAAQTGTQPTGRPLSVLKAMPEVLRHENWQVRVSLRGNRVVQVAPPRTPCLGMAVDVGTTKVACYLVDLLTGVTLARRGLMNPQIAYGEDVMARISYAIESDHPGGAGRLQSAIVETLNQAAADLCVETNQSNSAGNGIALDPSQIIEMVVVGNTAMHHIFLGLPVRQLGLAPYVPAVASAVDVPARDLGLKLAPTANVHLLPNIAGFVGADHVSMLLATGTHTKKGVVISLDIGTNTEITLNAHGRMLACSTASGPAFEGAHIKHGMRAADGAIERVTIIDNRLTYQTIGGKPPVGICGSGILDVVAQLKNAGVLNRLGSFDPDHPLVRKGPDGPEVLMAPADVTGHGREIVVTRKDVSEIQLAKGAMRAGLEILLKEAGLTHDDVDEFIIAGAFGTYIDVHSAVIVGMLPPIPLNRFRQVGNAAGIGAKMALVSEPMQKEAADIAKRVEYLELTTYPNFQSIFAEMLRF